MFLTVDPADLNTTSQVLRSAESQFFPWLIEITLVIIVGVLVWRFFLKDLL